MRMRVHSKLGIVNGLFPDRNRLGVKKVFPITTMYYFYTYMILLFNVLFIVILIRLSCLGTLVLLLPKLYIIWLSNLLALSVPDEALSVPDEDYYRNDSCALTLIFTLFCFLFLFLLLNTSEIYFKLKFEYCWRMLFKTVLFVPFFASMPVPMVILDMWTVMRRRN